MMVHACLFVFNNTSDHAHWLKYYGSSFNFLQYFSMSYKLTISNLAVLNYMFLKEKVFIYIDDLFFY